MGPRIQIHPVVIGTDANGEKGSNNDGHSHHEVEDFSDLDLDEISDDIDDEGADEGENVPTPSFRNLNHSIVIRNNP